MLSIISVFEKKFCTVGEPARAPGVPSLLPNTHGELQTIGEWRDVHTSQ